MVLSTLFLALFFQDPSALNAPRSAFDSCLSDFESAQRESRTPPGAFESAIERACKGEESMLVNALIKFDTAMGTARAEAEEFAAMDIEDYRERTKKRYREIWEMGQ